MGLDVRPNGVKLDWVISNKEWLFSGLAIAVPLAIIGWLFGGKKSKQTQKSGSHSTNIQAAGNVNIEPVKSDEPLVLRPHLKNIRARRSYDYDEDFIVVELEFCFSVENTSQQSVANWSVSSNLQISQEGVGLKREEFPKIGSGNSYIRLNSTILPTLQMTTELICGLKFKRWEYLEGQVREALEPATLTFKAISDNHVGEETSVSLRDLIAWDELVDGMKLSLKEENIRSLDTIILLKPEDFGQKANQADWVSTDEEEK